MGERSEIVEEGAGPLQCLRLAGALLRMPGEPLALARVEAEEIACLDDLGNLESAHWQQGKWIKGDGLVLDQMAECGAFCPGQGLAILACAGELWVWKKSENEPLWWHEDDVWITAIAGHPQLPLIATGHENGEVRIREAGSGKILASWQKTSGTSGNPEEENVGISSMEWHPTMPKLMFADEQLVIRGWDTTSEALIFELTGHKGRIVGLAWDPQDRYVFSAGWDGTVRVWNPLNQGPVILLNDHAPLVTAVVVSPDGRWLVAGDSSPSWSRWEIGTWKRMGPANQLASEPRFAIIVPEMGKIVFALADGRLVGLDLDPQKAGMGRYPVALDGAAKGVLQICGKEDWVCLLPEGGAQFWQKAKQNNNRISTHQAGHLADFKGPIRSLAIESKSLRMVTTHSRPGILRSWDLSRKHEGFQCALRSLQESVPGSGELLAIHPNAGLVVVGSQSSPDLGLYSFPQLEPVGLLLDPLKGNSIQDIAFSPGGVYLAVCGIGTLGGSPSEGLVAVFDPLTWQSVSRLDLGFWRFCWHPLENRLALAGPNGSLMEWGPESGRLKNLRHVSESPFSSMGYTADGKYLVVACGTSEILIFNQGSDLPVGALSLPGLVEALGSGRGSGEMGVLLAGGDGWLVDIPSWLAEKSLVSKE